MNGSRPPRAQPSNIRSTLHDSRSLRICKSFNGGVDVSKSSYIAARASGRERGHLQAASCRRVTRRTIGIRQRCESLVLLQLGGASMHPSLIVAWICIAAAHACCARAWLQRTDAQYAAMVERVMVKTSAKLRHHLPCWPGMWLKGGNGGQNMLREICRRSVVS